MLDAITQTQQEQCSEVAVALGKEIGQDWREHVEDAIRARSFEWWSCYGCGLRVKHEGYCHRCA